MDDRSTFLQELTGITNDLDNFQHLGVLYFYDLPPLPSKQATAPDGYDWCDFPYNYNTVSISPALCQLRYLIHRGYVRATTRILTCGIAVVRVYVLPDGISRQSILDRFHKYYVKLHRPTVWNDKTRVSVMTELLALLDYDREAWGLETEADLVNYTRGKEIVLLRGVSSAVHPFDPESLRTPLSDQSATSQQFNQHLVRLINGQAFRRITAQISSEDSLETRVTQVYAEIHSPELDYSSLPPEQKETVLKLLGGKVDGFTSHLYMYQRRSIAKMYEREQCSRRVPMPNIASMKRRGNKDIKYLDLTTLQFTCDPPTYNSARGGILAENMGLGKTCICLALVCLTKFEVAQRPAEYPSGHNGAAEESLVNRCVDCITRNSVQWKRYYDLLPESCVKKLEKSVGFFDKVETIVSPYNTRRTRATKESGDGFGTVSHEKIFLSSTTLVVVPDNLVPQWMVEIRKHVQKGYLKVLEIPNVRAQLPEDVAEIVSNDILLISLHAFARQSQNDKSILKRIYWKRLIVDEGHSMNSRSSQAVSMAAALMAERKWTITGTPTSGLTNLHVEEDNTEYTVKKNFDPRQDLARLGIVVSNFLQIDPWRSSSKLWSNTVVKPFEKQQFRSEYQLSALLQNLIIRHSIKDVQRDISLPPMHHKAVLVKPSFFDTLSINLFTASLASNAVTSERCDTDFMFHPSNKADLRRLVNNLRKATFYWTGFSVQDIQNLLNICRFAMKKNKSRYSAEDIGLLKQCIFVSRVALSNPRWRTNSAIHEMSYYISNLPPYIRRNFSIARYPERQDDFGSEVGVYGFPQLISVQRFYYKHRMMQSEQEMEEKMQQYVQKFWNYYGQTNDRLNGVSRTVKVANSELDFKSIDFESIKDTGVIPDWVDTFDPVAEERKFYSEKRGREDAVEEKSRAKTLRSGNGSVDSSYAPNQLPSWSEGKLSSLMRSANILGTASAKLSYLISRLLENQLKGIKSIVFYEFENSAYYLTEFLDILGMNYLLYSPNISQTLRAKNLGLFDERDASGGNGVVLVMDLKLASHGLTILAATAVFFISPVWNKTVEAQAIKRAHRIGQTHEVYVETLVLENTIEEEMYFRRSQKDEAEINDTEKELLDNTGIQNYIMKFAFLRMYEQEPSEIAIVKSRSSLIQPLKIVDAFDEDNGISLRSVRNWVSGGELHWELPLFSQSSMDEIQRNDMKNKKKRGGRSVSGRKLHREVSPGKNMAAQETVNQKTLGLIKKLQGDRKVHYL